MSTLILVAAVGVAEASRVLGIPPRTIYEWTADIGGVAGLRDRVREALGVTQYALALRVCDEVARRLGEFTPGELLDALRALAVGAVNPVAEAEHRDATTSPVSVTVQLVSPSGDPSGGSRTDTVPLDAVTPPPAQHLIEDQLAEKPAGS